MLPGASPAPFFLAVTAFSYVAGMAMALAAPGRRDWRRVWLSLTLPPLLAATEPGDDPRALRPGKVSSFLGEDAAYSPQSIGLKHIVSEA
jgi:hypothetical protein